MKKILQKVIDETINDPYIKWNNIKLKSKISGEYVDFIENNPLGDQNKRCHGYFPLLHNLISALDDGALIVELGNREGLSTISIIDALKKNDQFITFDIIKDLRFFPHELWADERFTFVQADVNDLESVDAAMSALTNKKIDLLFCDTLHTYSQITSEFEVFKRYLSPQAIILIDDIHLADKYRFFEEWEGKKFDITDPMHYPSGFGALVYEV